MILAIQHRCLAVPAVQACFLRYRFKFPQEVPLRLVVLIRKYPARLRFRFVLLQEVIKFGGQRNPALFVIFRNKIDVLFTVAGYMEFPLAEINVVPGRVRNFLFAAPRVKEKEISKFLVCVHYLKELHDLFVGVCLRAFLDWLGQAYEF